jgi:pimeloyl-ACP methyl ester carboxylesterase
VTDCVHRSLEANGIRMHIAEQGTGPLVLLCHGFPETWYSWRRQLPALAAAGYRAVAPDMRGYGQTDRPESVEQYTLLHMAGDMVGLLDELGVEQAVIVGHDWGAPVAWTSALLRPDRFKAVAALSVPYLPRGGVRPTEALRFLAGDTFMYIFYFQTPGVAEAELEQDVRSTIRRVLYWASGDAPGRPTKPKTAKFLDLMDNPQTLPPWLSEADVDVYAREFARTGFTGGLNWYRNLDRNWELMGAHAKAKITQPALFIGGDRDLVVVSRKAAVDHLSQSVPNLRKLVILPGCGHWTQQERPEAVNTELISFLQSLEGH